MGPSKGRERQAADDQFPVLGICDRTGQDPRRGGDQPGDGRLFDPGRAEDRRLVTGPARAEPRRAVRPDSAARRRGQDAPQGGRDPRLCRQAGLHPRPRHRNHRRNDRLRRRAVRSGGTDRTEPLYPRYSGKWVGCRGVLGPVPVEQRPPPLRLPDRARRRYRDALHPVDRQPRGLRRDPGGLGVEQQICVPRRPPVECAAHQL